MNKLTGPHACRSQSPSGSYRASIGFTPVGETCPHCEVKIIEEYILKVTHQSTESAQA